MAVKVLVGNLFDSQVQTLVNTVNCVGVMGKGIALEFKQRFPDMYQDYVERCKRQEVKLGKPYLYRQLFPPWILNFPTKDHWRSVANLASIVQGLEFLLQHYQEWGIESLAAPPLGAGQGQLEWRVIGPTLYRYLNQMTIPVELYAPYGTSHEELQIEFLQGTAQQTLPGMPEPSRIRPAWVALVEILRRLDVQPYHAAIGRTIFQKIAYVATEEGLPTGFAFHKDSYGPFSRELKPAIARLMNNGLIQEVKAGSMLRVKVGRTYADARREFGADLEQWDDLIEKVVDLFSRVRNTDHAELIATVLFAARDLQRESSTAPTERDVLNAVMDWKKKRRPPLDEKTVADTVRNLAILNWIEVRASEDLPVSEPDYLYA
jgi:uncharacterized protein YwgA/O-acetyl-ADP-ribose deacetylase (regulator of RNase III)